MKKVLATVLTLAMVASMLTACGNAKDGASEKKSEGVMTYAEYDAAALDTEVTIEAYVQAHQSWWDNKITVYAADKDGAYFLYEMACSEEDAAKLTPGTKFKAKGYKSEWSGEVEITDATFEIEEGNYVASPVDVTKFLGTDDLQKYQNQLVSFKDMTVSAVSYKNNEPGDDIYVNFTKDGNEYAFCLEYYLNGDDADFYNMVGSLEVGKVCDVEGFLYWYEGPNPHITKVTVK
ncbi:MAG: hypothetical protein K6A38_04885 [Lachnospiraceae bacterium]|nr:hypothetical protein [Lachnospiraceae bacterium]